MPLRLDLVRHGEALPAGPQGDAARPLSERGRSAIARLAQEYARRRWKPEMVWSSPLRRAMETAEILIAGAAPGKSFEVVEELSPEKDPAELVEVLAHRGAGGHVLLVGHQPLLGRLGGYLTRGRESSLPPAGLLALACEPPLVRGCARIELELHPHGIG